MTAALFLSMMSWWYIQHVPTAFFVFCFGACVGSFINVVIYRLPAGMSVISPPSRCPVCGARLKFFYENLPIVGYFLVRGKCRYCKVKISPQYAIIEFIVALTFVGMYFVLYAYPSNTPWWGQLGGQWWHLNSAILTAPAFIALAFMLAGLLAMTVIDARTFTIPIQIPLFVTFTAFIAYAVQALLPLRPTSQQTWPIQATCWPGTLASIGGMIGIAFSCFLLKTGRIRYSFADYADFLPPAATPGEPLNTDRATPFELIFLLPLLIALVCVGFFGVTIGFGVGILSAILIVAVCRLRGISFGADSQPNADNVLAVEYPHARREMKVEILFLTPCILLMVAGWFVGTMLPATPPPLIFQAIGASFAGYLVGGGLIWGIRIVGTLGFGREAMGLGDVHLLAAIGAVIGWFDPILIFFIAPFSGLSWAFLSMGIASVFKRARRELPYGPHLAVATLVMLLCRPGVHAIWQVILPTVPWPQSGLCETDASSPASEPRPGPVSRPTQSQPVSP